MFEDIEGGLKVRISVGIIRADAMPWQMLPSRLVKAIRQLVGQGVTVIGIVAPASRIMPHQAADSCIDVDGYQESFLDRMPYLAGDAVGPEHPFFKGDIVLLIVL